MKRLVNTIPLLPCCRFVAPPESSYFVPPPRVSCKKSQTSGAEKKGSNTDKDPWKGGRRNPFRPGVTPRATGNLHRRLWKTPFH